MFNSRFQVEFMSKLGYSISPGTSTDVNLGVEDVSNIWITRYANYSNYIIVILILIVVIMMNIVVLHMIESSVAGAIWQLFDTEIELLRLVCYVLKVEMWDGV